MNIRSKYVLIFFLLTCVHHAVATATERAEVQSRLREAIEMARDGKPRHATQIARQSIRDWQGHENEYYARFVLAVILQDRGDLHDAFLELQTVADHYDRLRDQATQRQVAICRALMSPERENGRSPGRRSRRRVVHMLESILMNDPLGVAAAAVHYHLGLYYEQAGRDELAKYYYETAANRALVAEWFDRAFFSTGRVIYHQARSRPRDISLAIEAQHLLSLYLEDPDTSIYHEVAGIMAETMREQIYDSAFEQAIFYDRNSFPPHTRRAALQNFLDDYPDAPQAVEAIKRLEEVERRFAAELDED